MAASYHIRSCSLPARLYPHGFHQIQLLLNKFPVDNNNSLTLLSHLYDSVSHLFNDSPSSLLLPHHSFFTHLLDLSLVHLDLCSKLRDITSRFKDCLRDLHSALRRRRTHSGEPTIRCHVKAFLRTRKALHKDLAKLLLLLKQTDLSSFSSETSHPLIRLLQQVCSQTCLSFRTVLLSLSTAVPKPRASKWALVTKLVIKNVTSTSGQAQTGLRKEFHMMDEELRRFSFAKEIKKETIKSMITSLGNVDVAVEDLEESLERLYRRMIQARVSLLNILSLHI